MPRRSRLPPSHVRERLRGCVSPAAAVITSITETPWPWTNRAMSLSSAISSVRRSSAMSRSPARARRISFWRSTIRMARCNGCDAQGARARTPVITWPWMLRATRTSLAGSAIQRRLEMPRSPTPANTPRSLRATTRTEICDGRFAPTAASTATGVLWPWIRPATSFLPAHTRARCASAKRIFEPSARPMPFLRSSIRTAVLLGRSPPAVAARILPPASRWMPRAIRISPALFPATPTSDVTTSAALARATSSSPSSTKPACCNGRGPAAGVDRISAGR